MVDLYPIL